MNYLKENSTAILLVFAVVALSLFFWQRKKYMDAKGEKKPTGDGKTTATDSTNKNNQRRTAAS